MTANKHIELYAKHSSVTVQVLNNLNVELIPHPQHEFLMSTKQVAQGYGVSEYVIRQHKVAQKSELIEGEHFFSGVSIPHVAHNGSTRGTMWTKRGIVRLGFFIRSNQAKLFRDWTENLVLGNLSKPIVLPSNPSRKHNRLTQERMIDILQDVCLIEDTEIRLRIANKLKGGVV